MDIYKESIKIHRKYKGKITVDGKIKVRNQKDLSLVYSPGVSAPCKEIADDPEKTNEYTARGNQIAVVTDGTAVLGMGDIGPKAALPVMEGKALLFREFAGVSAFPICLDTKETNEIIDTIVKIAPVFSGINLEDISSPRCFEIESRLQEILDIPVFHDDQHGTAIVVLAGIINALKLAKKTLPEVKIVLNGPGAAGTAIVNLLAFAGAENIVICDEFGILSTTRSEEMDVYKTELAKRMNPRCINGMLVDAVKNADIFIGVSVSNCLTYEMIQSMNEKAIVFALANPEPEISYLEAKKSGVFVYATGRSDYPNQINNVLAFPGIFRGLLDAKATKVTQKMKINAAKAIAELISDEELSVEKIIPDPFDSRTVPEVAKSIIQTWE